MNTYTIFAGVNGAGKSSLFASDYAILNKNEKRINTDEMVSRLGNWTDDKLQSKCAREAIRLIRFYLANAVSFNQETTLCGKSIISNIKKAKELGYYISVHFVTVNHYKIAQERVAHRVSIGGHGIPNEIIKKRYFESFENLKKIIPICDEIIIYENSSTDEMLRTVCIIENGNITAKDNLDDYYYIFKLLNL